MTAYAPSQGRGGAVQPGLRRRLGARQHPGQRRPAGLDRHRHDETAPRGQRIQRARRWRACPPAGGARRTTSRASRRSSPARPRTSSPGPRSPSTAAIPSPSEGRGGGCDDAARWMPVRSRPVQGRGRAARQRHLPLPHLPQGGVGADASLRGVPGRAVRVHAEANPRSSAPRRRSGAASAHAAAPRSPTAARTKPARSTS